MLYNTFFKSIKFYQMIMAEEERNGEKLERHMSISEL
jgi:hypothetical protein